MMHGRGKSDPVIGAVKPANKAAPTAAELVEQRPGAEGNASQQSAHRAQDRESVSQALERIRHAARSAVRRQAPKVRAVCINVHVRIGAGGAG
jgi:RNA-directed DNA polymerase